MPVFSAFWCQCNIPGYISQLFEPSSMPLGTAVPVCMLFGVGKGVKPDARDMWPKGNEIFMTLCSYTAVGSSSYLCSCSLIIGKGVKHI